jgi:regulatory protein
MAHPVNRRGRPVRPPKPLDPTRLNELALSYVARFATSGAKVERYLARKLREREWEGESGPDISGIVQRLRELGYVDDAAYAASRSRNLLRRGFGPRRVSQALNEAGIDAEIREQVRAGDAAERRAALALARKRRLGPFGPPHTDRPQREKQIAAMLRAGHRLDSAREMVDAATIEAAEQWVAEAEADES